MSFALQMAMAPRVALEVSPALVAFSEMLILPCAAMQAVVENELCANPALERLDAGGCPICRSTWRTRCPVCSVPTGRGTINRFADVADRAVNEPDVHALLRTVRMETSAADAPIVECLIDSLDEHGLLDRSCAEIAADLGITASVVERVLDVLRRCASANRSSSSTARRP
ncbi:MAG: Sigma-54 factor, core binding domain [Thermoleophilaceae bacterium]|nr:Sigma-54 factor, core binding domain [Thermoleophilaceae bacterium]